MPTLTLSDRQNLFDVIQLKAPNGGVVEVANTLIERNDCIKDVMALPANGGLSHSGARTMSLPEAALVDIGGVWGSSKGSREPFVEVLATIRSQFDSPIDVLKTEGKEISQALVSEENNNHIESLGQGWTNLWLQGPNVSNLPQQNAITGLMNRTPWKTYDDEYCFTVGGTGNDLRSAWLICPGATTFHFLYNPNHPTLGVERDETPKVWVPYVSATGASPTQGNWHMKIDYMLQMGVCVRDQRAVKRICNVPCGATDTPTATLINKIIAAATIKSIKNRPYFLYCDERLYTQLVLGLENKTFVYQSDQNVYRTVLPMIGPNIIVRRMDALNKILGAGETVVASA